MGKTKWYERRDQDFKKAISLIRHPSRDGELEKMPLDKIKNLAMNCFSLIENPTFKLVFIYRERVKDSHLVKEWVDFYKLCRFEKMMELKRSGQE